MVYAVEFIRDPDGGWSYKGIDRETEELVTTPVTESFEVEILEDTAKEIKGKRRKKSVQAISPSRGGVKFTDGTVEALDERLRTLLQVRAQGIAEQDFPPGMPQVFNRGSAGRWQAGCSGITEEFDVGEVADAALERLAATFNFAVQQVSLLSGCHVFGYEEVFHDAVLLGDPRRTAYETIAELLAEKITTTAYVRWNEEWDEKMAETPDETPSAVLRGALKKAVPVHCQLTKNGVAPAPSARRRATAGCSNISLAHWASRRTR